MSKTYVYTWWHIEGPEKVWRMVVAAPSKAEAARRTGYKSVSDMYDLHRSKATNEIETAMQSPGSVYRQPEPANGQPWKQCVYMIVEPAPPENEEPK